MVTVRVTDGVKSMNALWFNMPYIKDRLHKNENYVLLGRVTEKNGQVSISQPELFLEEEYLKLMGIRKPVYRNSDGISSNAFNKLVLQCIPCIEEFDESLSQDIIERRNLMPLKKAYYNLHFPESEEALIKARARLIFDEFFIFLLKLEFTRENRFINNYVISEDDYLTNIVNNLPFTLTEGQSDALNDIKRDLSGPSPMQRLLQGDVGSGKTIIAFLSMLLVSKNGFQSAIMAPTEVLAKQHYNNLLNFVEKFKPNTKVFFLSGSLTAAGKRKIKEEIKNTPSAMIVGTHALITENVVYNDLALVITDEQHRFGVNQRETLQNKGVLPHTLIMSATPIPRTLAIILYGDLSVSQIKSMPNNRLPIKNCVVKKSYRKTAYKFIIDQIKEGHQAYIICPLIEENEDLPLVDAVSYHRNLSLIMAEYGINVGLLHGKMKAKEKTAVMEAYLNGDYQILVSTTVIEVGVDVPNSTVMMIENAERFGLAQLHQLRGRVGRGDSQSYCIFIDGKDDSHKNERLEILNQSNDGFYIAEQDLKLRGPGDLFGIRQSGELDFRMADIYQDSKILLDAKEEAKEILRNDPELSESSHRNIKQMITM